MQADEGLRILCAIMFAGLVQSKMSKYELIFCCCEVIIAAALDPQIKSYLPHFGINMDDVRRWICT